jgi:hypothetical protein
VDDSPLPGAFTPLVGATVSRWHALPPGINYAFQAQIPDLQGSAAVWAEALAPFNHTTPLAKYTRGPFKGQAALTKHQVEKGQVFYLGFYPAVKQATALLAYIAAQQTPFKPLSPLPEGLVSIPCGEYYVLLNFTEQALSTTLFDQTINIQPRDVKVISAN